MLLARGSVFVCPTVWEVGTGCLRPRPKAQTMNWNPRHHPLWQERAEHALGIGPQALLSVTTPNQLFHHTTWRPHGQDGLVGGVCGPTWCPHWRSWTKAQMPAGGERISFQDGSQ